MLILKGIPTPYSQRKYHVHRYNVFNPLSHRHPQTTTQKQIHGAISLTGVMTGGAVEAVKAAFATNKVTLYGYLITFQLLCDLRQYQLIMDMATTLREVSCGQGQSSLLNDLERNSCSHDLLGYNASAIATLSMSITSSRELFRMLGVELIS
jgi:hypothetical protein